jgi:hypothetical protein
VQSILICCSNVRRRASECVVPSRIIYNGLYCTSSAWRYFSALALAARAELIGSLAHAVDAMPCGAMRELAFGLSCAIASCRASRSLTSTCPTADSRRSYSRSAACTALGLTASPTIGGCLTTPYTILKCPIMLGLRYHTALLTGQPRQSAVNRWPQRRASGHVGFFEQHARGHAYPTKRQQMFARLQAQQVSSVARYQVKWGHTCQGHGVLCNRMRHMFHV